MMQLKITVEQRCKVQTNKDKKEEIKKRKKGNTNKKM